jgi:hemolysin activation/secretion protein
MPRRGFWGVLCVSLFVSLQWLDGAAHAQFVERNLPPEPQRVSPAIRGAPELLRSDDTTPLGPDLKAIIVIGARDAVGKRVKRTGIDVRRADPQFAAAIQARVAPFLGQRLSRKLIADVQLAIADVYRDAGRPFVSVTLPPQEVTSGVVQIRVIPLRLGRVTIRGANPALEARIRDNVRLPSGGPIDARRLEGDLEHLNRSPFTRVEAVFGPGTDLGLTDLTLQVTEGKPWQVYGGYANSGTRLTDRNRVFTGAVFAIADVLASYQVTGSPDFWAQNGNLLPHPTTARYMSHAARVDIPVAWRTSINLVGDYVQTNERPTEVRLRTQVAEAGAFYRTAAANLAPVAFGNVFAGAEVKRLMRETYMTEVFVGETKAEVFQLVGGWNGTWADRYGTNGLDVRLKVNPGGVLPHNNSTDWIIYSAGRVSDVHTTLAAISYNRLTPLPWGLSLATQFVSLIGDKALPDTERVAVGGAYAVRGYVIEDGVVDRAFILRNALYLPSFNLLTAPVADRVAPFGFFDVGHGRDLFTQRHTDLASVGAGFDYQLGSYLRSNLSVGYALRDGANTEAGSWRVDARVVGSY